MGVESLWVTTASAARARAMVALSGYLPGFLAVAGTLSRRRDPGA